MQENILPIEEVGEKAQQFEIKLDAKECDAVADRIGVIKLSDIAAELSAVQKHEQIKVSGKVSYHVVQECVVTLEDVANDISSEFEVLFTEEEQELTDDTLATEEMAEQIVDGRIDLTELVIQQVSLSLPDYPRADSAKFEDHIEAPEMLEPIEERTHRPFADLLQGVEASNKDDE